MTNLHDIESAISKLNREQLAQFRSWYLEFDGDSWDQDIALDAASGKLDTLAREALQSHQRGETRPL